MNESYEINLISNRPAALGKRSFAFDKDVSLILSSLGSNHSYLDVWQTNRKRLLNTHMSILETIFQKISKETDLSIKKTDQFIEFLRVKSLQIHKFAVLNLKPISFRKQSADSLMMLEGQNKLQLDPFQEIWGNMDSIHADIQKKSQEFSNIIDQNILKSVLLEEQRNFTSVVSKFKAKVVSGKKRLEKLDQETEARFLSYCRYYDELVKDINIKKKLTPKKSIYLYEHEYLSVAFAHEKVQQEFSSNFIECLKEIWEKERSKNERIKEALLKYYEEFCCLFKSQRDLKILEGFINEIHPNTMFKRAFDMKNIFSEEQLKVFKNPDADLIDLEKYLKEFKLEVISESELILGKLTCMRQLNIAKKGDSGTWVDSIVIITKDSWLLIINDVQNMYKEPEYLLDLNRCSFHDRTEEMVVVINEKNKGWCKKALIHWIKLDSNNDREHFVELLKGGGH